MFDLTHDQIRTALSHIPAHDREVWVKIGNALKTELGAEGFCLFDDWSQTADSYKASDAKSVWKSLQVGKNHLGTIIHHAKLNGFDPAQIGDIKTLSPQEQADRSARLKTRQEQAAREEQEAAKAFIPLVADILEQCTAPPPPYAQSKRIGTHNLLTIEADRLQRFKAPDTKKSIGLGLTGALTVAPLETLDGELVALQVFDGIPDDKGKFARRYVGKPSVLAGYYRLGDWTAPTVIVITEGMADAVSCFEATGYPVLAAGSVGRLEQAAQAVKAKHPGALPVIVSDNDSHCKGQEAARSAAAAVAGVCVIPDGEGVKDANDLLRSNGQEAVKIMIDAAIESKKAAPPSEEDAAPETQTSDDSVADGGETSKEIDTHRNTPRATPAMLYGIFGEFGKAAAKNTEVNPYAAAINLMAYLSACFGRGVYFYIANDVHHVRLYILHIGRSSRGQKGGAHSLLNRVIDEIQRRHGSSEESLLPNRHTGGLSSKEGLARLIHDGYKQGKDESPAITDKRLFIRESEFANVMQQAARNGNTLSAGLRDAWDGIGIQPATKHQGIWASNPHIAISGACTPTELLTLTSKNDVSNGFLNRFIIFWGERTKLVPFPESTAPDVVSKLATKIEAIIQFAKGDYAWDANPVYSRENTRQITFSNKAKALYASLYMQTFPKYNDGENVAALLERKAPYLMRMAALFALSDLTLTVDEQHITAAYEWVKYWRESVKYIFNDAAAEIKIAETGNHAAKIVSYLASMGAGYKASRTELSIKVFKRHLSSTQLDDALNTLISSTPPQVEVIESERADGEHGRKKKSYRLCELCEFSEFTTAAMDTPFANNCELMRTNANNCELTESEQPRTDLNSQSSQTCEFSSSPTAPTNFAKFANFADMQPETAFVEGEVE